MDALRQTESHRIYTYDFISILNTARDLFYRGFSSYSTTCPDIRRHSCFPAWCPLHNVYAFYFAIFLSFDMRLQSGFFASPRVDCYLFFVCG